MPVYLLSLIVGAMCFMVSAKLKQSGKEREARFVIGLGIALMLASIVGAGLSIAGVL